MKPIAHSIGVLNSSEPPHMVAIQEKIFTPVGTAITMVATTKYACAPYVHRRHVDRCASVFRGGDHGDRRADRGENLLLDRHHVGRFARVQKTDAVGDGV